MSLYLITIGLIFGLVLLAIGVDRLYRLFAVRHPQLGPFRDSNSGCGSCAGSACAAGTCSAPAASGRVTGQSTQ